MRISYNVVRNMQKQQENEAKQMKQQASVPQNIRGKGEKPGTPTPQGLMPTTPTMSKPAQHQGTQGEFDAYNHNVKNRVSKLARNNTWETEEEVLELKQEANKIEFY